MDHKEKLKSIYELSFTISDINNIPEQYQQNLGIIADNVYTHKSVYTVLVTLLVHKILFPAQDIRYHQENLEGGFSGRSIDTKFITPTLKELGLPSMAESGWLARSMEQPYPYTLSYQGKISNKNVKSAFLEIIDFIEKYPECSENILRFLLYRITIQPKKPKAIFCINEKCSSRKNLSERIDCQSCGSNLLLDGNYRVLKQLGEGGYGKAYEVLDSDDQFHVLKILIKLDKKSIELFNREIDVIKKLNHTGIPKYQDDFTFSPNNSQDKYPCLVMEKIEGENLREWMEKRNGDPINEKRALDWLEQLTLILHNVHQNNLFHRDIKPSNIMLKNDGRLVLIDFGAVRVIDDDYKEDIKKGIITKVNSEGYSPLEQEIGQASHQSDFFALGRTFVYLLTGKEPCEISEISPNLHTDTKFNWRDENPNIPQYLADFIDKLMNKNINNRPKDTAEILNFLQEPITKNSSNIFSEPTFPARVAHVESRYVLIINRGSVHGIQIGQKMRIYACEEEIKDPLTEEIIGYSEIEKGIGKIIRVREKISFLRSNQVYSKVEPSLLSKSFSILDRLAKINEGKLVPFDDPEVGDRIEPI
jgi:serine/threonine protein kinase